MSNQPAYPNPSGYDYMQPPAAPPRNYNAPPANYPQQYQPIQNIHADNQIMVGQPDAGGPGYMQIGPPVHWCAYVWIIIVLALFVLLDAITYFAIPTWYNYCYFYIGPHTVWPAFSHWSEDTTIDTLKNDICRTGAGGSETNLIATCISAYCPKICHYFKNDITDAANAQMPFSVLYIVLGCLTIVLIFVQATCLRNRPNTRPVFIIFCISCFLMWMFQLIAFVRYNSVGDFDGFKSVQDSIIPGCYFSYDDSDVSADDADKPNNSSKAGGYYWALVLLIINSITLLALFPRMLWNLRLSR